jgi:hypothetical protein
MHKSICIAVLMALFFGFTQAQAQTRTKSRARSDQEQQTYIYIVAGLAHYTGGINQFQVGGGVDSYTYKGFSISGELAQTVNSPQLIVGNFARSTIVSANGNYHLLKGIKSINSKFDPFVTGGYSRFFQTGQDANSVNIGGGVNLWLSKKFGLRADICDHIVGGTNFVNLRGGFAFAF